MKRIIFTHGKNPKPPPADHRQQLLRCLLHGVAKIDREMATEIASSDCFTLVAWSHLFHPEHSTVVDVLPWIDRLLTEADPPADVKAARPLKYRVARAMYTLGDHLPYIALGQALTARGHRVRLVFNQAMHSYAQRAGLEVMALSDIERGPEEARENAWAWDHWNYPRGGPHPKAKAFHSDDYVTQVRELMDACREADLLVATSIRPHGYSAANALGIPWLTASLNPFISRIGAQLSQQ